MNETLKKKPKYQKRYMERHKMLCVLLSNERDKDIIDWLRTQENASESVRRALRSSIEYQDMTKTGR
jgi:hypothetical protein